MDGSLGNVALIGFAIAFPVLLAMGAMSDLLRYLIPNWIPVAVAVCAVPALLAGAGPEQIAWHLATGLAVLALTSILFFRGLLGGGDVKLLAAAACWAGWPLVVPLVVYTAVAGGLVAAILIIARRLVRKGPRTPPWLATLMDSTSGVPYALAIAVGGCLVWPRLLVYSAAF